MQVSSMPAFSDCIQIDGNSISTFAGKAFRSFIVNSINFGSARTLTISFTKNNGSTGTIVVNAVRNTSDGRIILVNESGLQITSIIDSLTLTTPAKDEVLITLLT
jgi:hypothetical protein